jgi:hypothetical protein
VLLIDDCSTDDTLDVIIDYARRNPGLVTPLLKPERTGYVDSVNLGLTVLGAAENVALFNDDDLWHPEKLAMQMSALADHPDVGLIATEAFIIDENGRQTGELMSDLYYRPDEDRLARQIVWHGNCLCAPSVLITRRGLDVVTPYYDLTGGCNDMHMWLTISARLPVLWLSAPLTYYRVSANQMTTARRKPMMREMCTLRRRALRESPAVYDAAGGESAVTRLDGQLAFWATWYLRDLELKETVWYSWQIVKERRLRPLLVLLYVSVRALPSGLQTAVARLR